MNEKNIRIIERILCLYGVSINDFRDTTRKRGNISEARHCIYYVFHVVNGYSLRTIKRILKTNGDAHNINYGVNKIKRIMDGYEESCIVSRFGFFKSLVKTLIEEDGSRFNREVYKQEVV